MILVLIAARLLLSAIFLIAGWAKLADLPRARQSVRDFGFPEGLTAVLAVLLPVGELVVGIGLIPARFAWYAAFGALALLTAFVLVIAVNLIRGRTPDCNCFGQLHSQPIGWDLVARNIGLALIPGLMLSQGPSQPSITGWISEATAGQQLSFLLCIGVLAAMAAHGWLTFQLVQQGGRVLLRLDNIEKRLAALPADQAAQSAPLQVQVPAPPSGLPVGEKAPSFSLPDLDGRITSLEELLAPAKPVILLFTHPDCGPCAALLAKAEVWQQQTAAHCRLVLISQGKRKQNLAKIKGLRFPHYFLQDKQEVAAAYDSLATPSAVLVRPDGIIGSPVASGTEQIQSLIVNLINSSIAGLLSLPLKEGDAAPPLVYPDMGGTFACLSDLRGAASLILFWNPACGFCQQMVADVKSWENGSRATLPTIVLISSGSGDDNRTMGLHSRILLDSNFSAGKAFGVGGTPSAVWLDGQGRVSSKLAVGRDEIMSLLSNRAAR